MAPTATPTATLANQADPYAKYGGAVAADPYAKYGGSLTADTTTAPQPFGNAGNAQKPMVTPIEGEDFATTMQRGANMGRNVTPQQIQASTQTGIKQVPTVLGAALAGGPALMTAGAIAPAMASEAAGGGVLGGAAGGATAGAGMSALTQPTQGQNPFSSQGLQEMGKSALVGGITGGVVGAVGKLYNYLNPPVSKVAEWQAINDELNVPKKSIAISKTATSLEDAAKNPGRGVSAIGLDSNTLSKMSPMEQMQAIAPEWQKAGAAIDKTVADATNNGVKLDIGKSAFETLKKIPNPTLQQQAIDKFNELAQDAGIINQRQATPSEALALRRSLQAGARFGPNGDLNSLGGIRAALYRGASGDLQGAVTGLDGLDQHYADMKGAVDAAQSNVVNSLRTADPTTMQKIMANPIAKELVRSAVYGSGAGAVGYGLYRMFGGNTP